MVSLVLQLINITNSGISTFPLSQCEYYWARWIEWKEYRPVDSTPNHAYYWESDFTIVSDGYGTYSHCQGTEIGDSL